MSLKQKKISLPSYQKKKKGMKNFGKILALVSKVLKRIKEKQEKALSKKKDFFVPMTKIRL